MYIYVLKLESNKYYVGKTDNPDFRLNDHFTNNGSIWTKIYKPIQLHQLIPDCDKAKSVRAPTRLTRSPLSNVFPCLHIITRAIRSYHHVEVVNFQLI